MRGYLYYALVLLLFKVVAESSESLVVQGMEYNAQEPQEEDDPAKLGFWQSAVINAGVSAMHMILLPSNKVLIFDRTDFGRSNITLPPDKCRDDPNDLALQHDCWAHSVLYDLHTGEVRPLMVQTDTWCSSGGLDANGDVLQTGGYNDGARMVRHFPGHCGASDDNCDWDESAGPVLGVARWYASNQALPDNRFIIVGGRRQFSYEFYPPLADSSTDSKVYQLPFLYDTYDPGIENNLYPFVHLSTDGNLFIFANARSILFDYKSNRVLRHFPPMPPAEEDGSGEAATPPEAHNYPSSGSSVLLPIRAANNYRVVDVLVCGGAPSTSHLNVSAGVFLPASRHCGLLRISDSSPTWMMANMPFPRVMGDLILLPTSDVLLINGAQRGVAGWESARKPALHPVLYDPYGTQHFIVLNPTETPRLYHSTAVLLPDGRILVGGSNPHVNYNFTDPEFPTQVSLDYFNPPYLDPAYAKFRPFITGLVSSEAVVMTRGRRRWFGSPGPVDPDVRYGSRFLLEFHVDSGVQSNHNKNKTKNKNDNSHVNHIRSNNNNNNDKNDHGYMMSTNWHTNNNGDNNNNARKPNNDTTSGESVDLQINIYTPPFNTHSYSMNQRLVRLNYDGFTRHSETSFQIYVDAPPNSTIAPTGYYLLFIVHSTIPSPGLWIRIH